MPASNPLQEARDRVGERYEPRVLEPSPPVVVEAPWFADDPVARGEAEDSRPILSPVTTGDVLWDDVAREDPGLAEWCAERWLGAYKTLGEPPAELAHTRAGLHALAEHIVSPTRQRAVGEKIGLRWTRGGFGTPFFGNDVQLRVVGDVLAVQLGEGTQQGRLTTLKDAAEFVGFDLTRFDLASAEEPLRIDPAAAAWLGDLFGFATSVLEQLRAEGHDADEPSRVQLWPEHFDVALELGDEQAAARAAFGVSPGDDAHAAPYLYVAPWVAPERDDGTWNATAFPGAELTLGDILDAPDQRAAALDFFRERRAALVA